MEAPWWIRKPVDVWRRLGRSRATGGAGDDKAGCARGRDGEPLRRGDRLVFTATTAVFQPLSGLWLMHLAGGMPLATPWIAWSLWLYVLAIACWRPVVWIRLRLRDLSARAAAGQCAAQGLLAPVPVVGGAGLRRFRRVPGDLLPHGGQAAAVFFFCLKALRWNQRT
jgi:hypothetical protein